MLYYAWASEPGPRRGAVVDISPGAASPLAPPAELLAGYEAKAWDWGAVMDRYDQALQARWDRDPQPFLDLVAQAAAGDVTLVCGYARHEDDEYWREAAPRCYCYRALDALLHLGQQLGTPIEPPGFTSYEITTG
jgi:hypothetical protein